MQQRTPALIINYSKPLGKGAYAIAYCGSFNNQPVAVKMSKPNNANGYSSLKHEKKIFEYLINEIKNDTNEHIGANCIIECMASCDQGITAGFALVLEFANRGSLEDMIYDETKPRLSINAKHLIACDIAKGLSCLHHYQLIHCDIKPDNVLLVEDTASNRIHAKLTDLGLSCLNSVRGEPRGAILYRAPETLKKIKQNKRSDVYSLGITLWEMIAEKEPYHGHNQTKNKLYDYVVTQGKRPRFPDDCPVKLSEVVRLCWRTNPKSRLIADECVTLLNNITEDDLKITLGSC